MMDDQDKKEFEQACFDTMHKIMEACLERVHEYRVAHPEKFTHHIEIKLHKIEK